MKTFELKAFKLGETDVKYVDLVKACINNTPREGLGVDEMKSRLRIATALEGKTDSVELEDADVTKLKALVKEMRWNIAHQGLVDFCDAVDKL